MSKAQCQLQEVRGHQNIGPVWLQICQGWCSSFQGYFKTCAFTLLPCPTAALAASLRGMRHLGSKCPALGCTFTSGL